MTTPTPLNNPSLGIAFVIAGAVAISLNDMIIKQLSGGYPLHQIVFTRSAIGILLSLVLVWYEGGFHLLKTRQPGLHSLRGVLVVLSNMSFFVALAVLPLADATALFFAAPLFITLLSIPILGEKVGPMRLTAVAVGFAGVVIMQRPWAGEDSFDGSRLVLMLPVFAALTYGLNQLMTRKLGATTKASALSVYIQAMFIVVSIGFFIVAGDGRFAENSDNGALIFLLRAWVWPAPEDYWVLIALGANSALIGYCLSQGYRLADAATAAPFEYVLLPLSVVWGYFIFADVPVWEVWIGIVLILGSGLFVFLRERKKARGLARTKIKSRR